MVRTLWANNIRVYRCREQHWNEHKYLNSRLTRFEFDFISARAFDFLNLLLTPRRPRSKAFTVQSISSFLDEARSVDKFQLVDGTFQALIHSVWVLRI